MEAAPGIHGPTGTRETGISVFSGHPVGSENFEAMLGRLRQAQQGATPRWPQGLRQLARAAERLIGCPCIYRRLQSGRKIADYRQAVVGAILAAVAVLFLRSQRTPFSILLRRCLSLKACALYNPNDAAQSRGTGPRYLLGAVPKASAPKRRA